MSDAAPPEEDNLRPAELEGRYYPAGADGCRQALAAWPPLEGGAATLAGALVPHGGWRYAGRIAAGTLKALHAQRPTLDLLVVLGGHLTAGEPVRVFIDGAWATPLGPVPTPNALAESVAMPLSAEPESAEEYYDDNAVEVLMPMLRALWPNTPTLVVGVPPDADPGTVGGEIAAQVASAGYDNPAVIGSVDLTHYGPDHNYRPRGSGPEAHRWVMEENDAAFVAHAEALNPHKVAWEGPRLRNTCSPGAAAAALWLAKKWGATEGRCVARSTSWLEAGQPNDVRSFVGYAGVLLGTDFR